MTCAKLSVDSRVAEWCRTSPVSCLNRDGGGEGQGSLKNGDYCKFAACLFFACAISSIFIYCRVVCWFVLGFSRIIYLASSFVRFKFQSIDND